MKRNWILMLAIGIANLGSWPPLAAQDAERPWKLTRAECLQMALENNLDLVSARIDPQVSEAGVLSARSTFDPGFSATASTDESSQTPVDPTQPQDRSNVRLSTGVTQQLGFGGDYTASFSFVETDSAGFNIGANPFQRSTLFFQHNLPLRQGLGKEVRQETVLIAERQLEIDRDAFVLEAETTIERVEGAYWDLLAAKRALEVQLQSRKLAQDLLDLNRKKVEVGTLAPIDITQAEAGVADQEELVIVRQTALENAADVLRQFMAIPEGDARWERPIEIADRPSFEPLFVNQSDAVETALANRPEMKQVRKSLLNLELSERVARKNVRHRLNFKTEFAPNGDNDSSFVGFADFDMNPVTPDTQGVITVKDGVADSLTEIFDVDNYFWNVELAYSFPIGNRAAKADYRTKTLRREQGEVAIRSQEQSIRVEVRSAVRAVESGIKRVEAAQKNVELQEKKLEAEQKKFENGMSTSFQVLEFQEDLAQAQLSLINAGLTYTKALAALERVQGTLLEARNLRIEG